MSLLSLLALSLTPLTAKLQDSPDVALTRATEKIAELEQALADLTVRTEALERSIDRMRAEPPRQMTQHELINEAQRLATQSQMMQSQQWMQQNQNAQAMAQQLQNYTAGLVMHNHDARAREEYIRNCTPGRAEVLRRSP